MTVFENSRIAKGCLILILAFVLAASVLYLVAHDQILYREVTHTVEDSDWQTPVGEITADAPIEQDITLDAEWLDSVSIRTGTYDRTNTGTLWITLMDQQTGHVYLERDIPLEDVPNNEYLVASLNEPVQAPGEKDLVLRLTSDGQPGNAVTVLAAAG